VTHFTKMMLEELQRRNYSEDTIRKVQARGWFAQSLTSTIHAGA